VYRREDCPLKTQHSGSVFMPGGEGHALDTQELLRKAASIHKKSYSCHRECEQETWQLAIAIEQSMGVCDQSQIVDLALALNDVLEIRDQNKLSRLKP